MVKLIVGAFAEGVEITGLPIGRFTHYSYELIDGMNYRVIDTCNSQLDDSKREIHRQFIIGEVFTKDSRRIVKEYEV